MSGRALAAVAVAFALGFALATLLFRSEGRPGAAAQGVRAEPRVSKEAVGDPRAVVGSRTLEPAAEDELQPPREEPAAERVAAERVTVDAAPPPEEAPDVSALETQIAELARQVERLTGLTEALRTAQQRGAAAAADFPSLEAIEQAPEANAAALQQLVRDFAADSDALILRLRWTSQEEVLRTYGRPSYITAEGTWTYSLQGVTFEFVRNYVMRVNCWRR